MRWQSRSRVDEGLRAGPRGPQPTPTRTGHQDGQPQVARRPALRFWHAQNLTSRYVRAPARQSRGGWREGGAARCREWHTVMRRTCTTGRWYKSSAVGRLSGLGTSISSMSCLNCGLTDVGTLVRWYVWCANHQCSNCAGRGSDGCGSVKAYTLATRRTRLPMIASSSCGTESPTNGRCSVQTSNSTIPAAQTSAWWSYAFP